MATTTRLVPPVTDIVLYKRADETSGLKLRGWQWGFGALAPFALIVIDLRLLGGWLMQLAPAAFWMAAVVGPMVLMLSQKRWRWRWFDLAVSGAVAVGAGLALIGAILPVLLILLSGIAEAISGTSTLQQVVWSTLLGAVALIFTWPLFFTGGAYRRQAKLRIRRRPDMHSTPLLIGMVVLPAVLASAEVADRIWFGGVEDKLASRDVPSMVEGVKELHYYPVGLLTKTDQVCSALYAQAPDGMVSAENLDARLDLAWGEDAETIRGEARRMFGKDAQVVCADALMAGPF